MYRKQLRDKVIILRGKGKTYPEIQKILRVYIPKSTLSCWCNSITLPDKYRQKFRRMILGNIKKSRLKALAVIRRKRQEYFRQLYVKNKYLIGKIKNYDVAKIALALLYWAEGKKNSMGSLMFGNSDPEMINTFLTLLRKCYSIDQKKIRCTLQCRADQNIPKLELFWSKITGIPLKRFYKARVDPRTIGKPSKKKDYKGVCRIDYFCADIHNELRVIANLIGQM